MNPIAALTLKGMSRSHKVYTPPTRANGIPGVNQQHVAQVPHAEIQQQKHEHQRRRDHQHEPILRPFEILLLASPFDDE